jgi:transcriptional regulator with XRE-family HTH domain
MAEFYELGNRIRIARRSIGLTQQEFAKLIGYNFRTVSGWECGESAPRGKALEKISLATGYDIRFFTHGGQHNNPYWDKITEIAVHQRMKGLEEYGRGLEDNPLKMVERLIFLEEELIDALYYIEHIKEKFREIEGTSWETVRAADGR